MNCGATSESCCASLSVTGGTYERTYTNSGSGATGLADPATVSGFRLDKYLVTVGRFRQFVSAWNGGAGYLPAPGSGKHTHVNGGSGLDATAGGYEPGWIATDDSNVSPTTSNLACDPNFATWTASTGAQENDPINCVVWYEAYAFCIWDGGFLPSEAEWEYAAAGGSRQLEYPWGSNEPGTQSLYAIYGNASSCYYPTSAPCTGVMNIAPAGSAPLGAGRWGQLDLAGEVWEWNLDWFGTYGPGTDSTNVTATDFRVLRGGEFLYDASYLAPSYRSGGVPSFRASDNGFRCARTP
jgi:sulfatase modifying factor 1